MFLQALGSISEPDFIFPSCTVYVVNQVPLIFAQHSFREFQSFSILPMYHQNEKYFSQFTLWQLSKKGN